MCNLGGSKKKKSHSEHVNDCKVKLITSVHDITSFVSRRPHLAAPLPQLWLIKQGDACEEALQRHLVEDKSPNGGASYADFLYHLHVNSVRLLQ